MVLLRCCVNIAIGSRMPLLGPFVANIHSFIHSFFHSMYSKLQYNNNDTEIRVSKRKITRFSLIFRRYKENGQQTNPQNQHQFGQWFEANEQIYDFTAMAKMSKKKTATQWQLSGWTIKKSMPNNILWLNLIIGIRGRKRMSLLCCQILNTFQ